MELQDLMELMHGKIKADKVAKGQQTLGYLHDVLEILPPDTPIKWDTGHQFGNDPIEYIEENPYSSEYYSHDGYAYARSDTAHPSCYRGYYSDCTFNCSLDYEQSTVGHVLKLVNETIGKSFDGYRGGVNKFTRGTLVWGGDTSYASVGNYRQLVGFTITDDGLILNTIEEEW